MRRQRKDALARQLVRAAAGAGLALGLAVTGCTKSDTNETTPDAGMMSADAGGAGQTDAGGGGQPDAGATLGKGDIQSVSPLSTAANFSTPTDATPSPDGTMVYFVAQDADGAGVYSLPAAGGSATRLASAGPLVLPFGIVVSTDGTTLFVADSGAEEDGVAGLGRIFSLPSAGGSLTALAGATGLVPKSLDLVKEGNVDVLYFTGRDPATRTGAVFKMDATGLGLTTIATGLGDPSGVAVTKQGTVLVADAALASGGAGIVKIEGGTKSELAANMRFGAPAGIALVQDESALFVSGLDLNDASSLVFRVELATGQVATFNTGISQNHDSAGLRRAHAADVYAWADGAGNTRTKFNAGGNVYLLK